MKDSIVLTPRKHDMEEEARDPEVPKEQFEAIPDEPAPSSPSEVLEDCYSVAGTNAAGWAECALLDPYLNVDLERALDHHYEGIARVNHSDSNQLIDPLSAGLDAILEVYEENVSVLEEMHPRLAALRISLEMARCQSWPFVKAACWATFYALKQRMVSVDGRLRYALLGPASLLDPTLEAVLSQALATLGLNRDHLTLLLRHTASRGMNLPLLPRTRIELASTLRLLASDKTLMELCLASLP